MKTIQTSLLTLLMISIFISCSKHPKEPSTFEKCTSSVKIFPDYTDVTVPYNIAPLNFKVLNRGDQVVAKITDGSGHHQTYGDGKKVEIPQDEWASIMSNSKGKPITIDLYVEDGGKWFLYNPFKIDISEDPIDEYISYRLINPSYVAYEDLRICERNLTNFDEEDIYCNLLLSAEDDGQCINCHSYQNYHTNNMQFHMRQGHGGTMIVYDGKATKVNLKTDSTISAGVYPSWHPTLPIIAYSTNSTGQSFHTRDRSKIEVSDAASDLILYDVLKNEVSIIENDSTEFEVFPWWSPDGKTLYYCSAHFEFNDSIKPTGGSSKTEDVYGNDTKDKSKLELHQSQIIERYTEIKYNIYRKPFDSKTLTFGPSEMVFNADSLNRSATLPRISPDGRYLLYGLGNFGCFHIWHPDADLWITDLQTMESRALTAANSPEAESYHSWSSNGRWILFATRRDDGNYSRLYISYFDRQGHAHKAFEVPQKDPDFYREFLKSYNVPEFMVEPLKVSPQEFCEAAQKDAVAAKQR